MQTEAADPKAAKWSDVLAHRQAGQSREAVAARFVACGVRPEQVRDVLADGGDALYEAARSGRSNWCDAFGGPLAVALLAAEVSAFAAELNSRASGVRSLAVASLLEDFSAVTVAAELGISRQKAYEIARGGLRASHLKSTGWGCR